MEEIELIRFNEKRDFSELFSATFSFIKQEFKLFFTCLLVYVVPILIFDGIIQSLLLYGGFHLKNENDTFSTFFNPIFLVYQLLNILTGIISIIMLYGITLGYIKTYNENTGNLTRELVWNNSKPYFMKIFGFGFITSLVIGFSTIFFVLPGIYFLVALCLVLPIAVFEDETLGASFSRSMYLIKDYWWITFGGLILVAIINIITSMIFTVPNLVFTELINLFFVKNGKTPGIIIHLIQSIFVILSSLGTLIGSFAFIYLAFQYHNLVERKEEPTLLDEIESLGTELR